MVNMHRSLKREPLIDQQIGVTERGDAALDLSWRRWVHDGRPTILITKDPGKLLQHLPGLPTDRIIVHCTITGHGETPYEPNVPHQNQALRDYERLVGILGPDRTVLRIDPIFPWVEGVEVATGIAVFAQSRVRISILDNYTHLFDRFDMEELCPPAYEMHASLRVRKWIVKKIDELVNEVEVCGEPGIPQRPCVSLRDCELLGVEPMDGRRERASCECLGNKRELLQGRERCSHGCVFCYWK